MPAWGEETSPFHRGRASFVHLMLALVALTLVWRAAELQVVETARWQQVAQQQQQSRVSIVPPRGSVLDATGTVLVQTRELMTLAVAPRDVKPIRRKGPDRKIVSIDSRAVLRKGLRDLRVPDSLIRRALDPKRRWVEFPQKFLAADLERFVGLPGVHRTRVYQRVNSAPEGLRGVIGAINTEGNPVGGLELELDSLLRGAPGSEVFVREGGGGRMRSPEHAVVAAQPGHTVILTINQALQEIAEQELRAARERTGASGGDVVILDPRDGAILALAGIRDGKAALTSTPLAEPYEPGSVMKPFVVARLLDLQRARADETINTENGEWKVAGRTLRDEHKEPVMTVRDVIRLSSNIGTAKLALRLDPREEFEALRDFGFGSYTGVPYPAESRGRVPLPAKWGGMTPASLSIGYELSATPMQIAAAYGALANGGELLQPVLVREVRSATDSVVYAHRRRVVRRVVTPATAAVLREMLESVVDSGTARAADLAMFDVAGKSGTARRQEAGKGYAAGLYNASFAGMFPASNPQLVIVARLIDPEGTYFGGIVAGTMVKGIIEAALATASVSFDRGELERLAKPLPLPKEPERTPEQLRIAARDSARRDSLRAPLPAKAEPIAAPARAVVELPVQAIATTAVSTPPASLRPVPSVFGLDARQAARALLAAGFQVAIINGTNIRTRPQAGTLLRAGSTVELERPR
jgi:cell division protein FtsI (penicillin-binding protein 3)